jgi:hypothetical protein
MQRAMLYMYGCNLLTKSISVSFYPDKGENLSKFHWRKM